MTPTRIFIGGARREFARERAHLRDYLRGDPLMRRFFEVLVLEPDPARDGLPDAARRGAVEHCDIYVGLLGADYGLEDDAGISPAEREFDRAVAFGKHRLIFVKGAEGTERHPGMRALIDRAHAGIARRRFTTPAELVAGLYAALLRHVEAERLLHRVPFDAEPCSGATTNDLDAEAMGRFIRTTRRSRGLPVADAAPPTDLLRHLGLLWRGRLTNAAILLFGQAPQRFLISSEVECAHFHGTAVARPIPYRRVYRGTVFELVDQAVDFVLGAIDRTVGTRAKAVQAPVTHEIPEQVVTEAIVNAVAHRDYAQPEGVQVLLFRDRLEVVSPGHPPPSRRGVRPRMERPSIPTNPLIAAPMHLLGYGEGTGAGTGAMTRLCAEAGLPGPPEFEEDGGFFTTRIWRVRAAARNPELPDLPPIPAPPDTTQNAPPTAPTTQISTRERILALLRAEPKLTRNDLALRTGITPHGVKYHLARLKKAGLLRRVGSDRAGHWEVLCRQGSVHGLLDPKPHDHDA